MSLTINSPTLITSPPTETLNKTNVSSTITPAALSISAETATTSNLLKPSPIIQVRENPTTEQDFLESPYIKVTEQLADISSLSRQNYSQATNIDNTPQQIRSLTEQQQDIQVRQKQLQNQELEINREISSLQQKELEINRKKFQLQQQTTGSLVNIRV